MRGILTNPKRGHISNKRYQGVSLVDLSYNFEAKRFGKTKPKIMHLALIFVAALAGQIFRGIGAQGSIKTPKAKGAHVVKAVVDQIHGLGIFPDDHKFLCRIAWVESKYGNARGTYRAKYYGGIWQVDEVGYGETVRQQGLRKYWNRIKARLGIDWTKTTWNDLEKPLYSGLAARLFLARLSAPIPTDLRGQASYWKTHYNTAAGNGTAQKFLNDIRQATAGCAV